MLILSHILQVYIVTGGRGADSQGSHVASTEIMEKDGSEWQEVASLPSARHYIRGVGLDHGRFIITGEC